MSDYSGVPSSAISLAVNLTIVGAFFAAGVALALRLATTLPPRLRYAIALTGFLAAAALPVASTLNGAGEPTVAAHVKPGRLEQPTIDAASNRGTEAGHGEVTGLAGHPLPAAPPRPNPPGWIPSLPSMPVHLSVEGWPGVAFVCLWALVALVLLGREVLGCAHFAKARRAWRPGGREVLDALRWPDAYPLFISEHDGPYTVGLFRPAVVIPAGLLEDISPDEARLIARHELAHARWRDPLANALVRITRALAWPSLPLWFLARAVRVEREAAADLSAVAASRREDIKGAAAEYAALLVLVARLSGGRGAGRAKYRWAATQAGDHVDLESRVRRLLTLSARTNRARLLLAALALSAATWGASSPPVTAQPALLTPDPTLSDIAAADRDDVFLGRIFPAAPYESTRVTLDRQSDGSDTGREVAESAATPEARIAGQTLTKPGARAREGEADRHFVNEMAALGYTRLSPEQLAAMKAHGVSAAYVAEMAASGYAGLAADELINFRLLGVNSAYVRAMGGLGYSALPPNTMIDFRLYGITPAHVKELAASGFPNLPAGKVVAFRRAGIDAAYIKQIGSGISGGLSPDQLLALRNLGATEGHIKELKARGVENLTAARAIDALTQKVAARADANRGGTDNE